ncbi:MAG: hypothetical protein NDI61_10770 [Bdellovibrionaceae bacterium]|nr:hypothetical protein [Pseudobdellovibrionaceae bacterium]
MYPRLTQLLCLAGAMTFATPEVLAKQKEPLPIATPTAAGSASAQKKRPSSDAELADDEGSEPDDPVSIGSDNSSPEPFLCEFSWTQRESAVSFRWQNTGSDFPRVSPPVTKRELLSPPFTRSKSDKGPSWGSCAEIEESANPGEISVVLFAHTANGKTVPDGNSGRCRWVFGGPYYKGQARLKIRLDRWAGIEFETAGGERKRVTVHWPEKANPEPDGALCREMAEQMNQRPTEMNRSITKLKLSVTNTGE